jgi:hypothetical protein
VRRDEPFEDDVLFFVDDFALDPPPELFEDPLLLAAPPFALLPPLFADDKVFLAELFAEEVPPVFFAEPADDERPSVFFAELADDVFRLVFFAELDEELFDVFDLPPVERDDCFPPVDFPADDLPEEPDFDPAVPATFSTAALNAPTAAPVAALASISPAASITRSTTFGIIDLLGLRDELFPPDEVFLFDLCVSFLSGILTLPMFVS